MENNNIECHVIINSENIIQNEKTFETLFWQKFSEDFHKTPRSYGNDRTSDTWLEWRLLNQRIFAIDVQKSQL